MDKNGVTVPMGIPGEVWFKGYNVMPGYWNDEEMTKKAIDDGWLRSGYFIETLNYLTASLKKENQPTFCFRCLVIY